MLLDTICWNFRVFALNTISPLPFVFPFPQPDWSAFPYVEFVAEWINIVIFVMLFFLTAANQFLPAVPGSTWVQICLPLILLRQTRGSENSAHIIDGSFADGSVMRLFRGFLLSNDNDSWKFWRFGECSNNSLGTGGCDFLCKNCYIQINLIFWYYKTGI